MELGMRKSIVATVITLGVLASPGAHAQNSWSTRSELGFVASRGNTSTETANAKIQVIREVKRWKYTLETTGLYGKSQGIATAQHVDARLQVAKSFGKDERWFWFGAGRYEDDRFSGFDYQTTVTTGLGRKFIDTDTTKLTAQVGGGYRALRPELIVRDDITGLIVARVLGERDSDLVVNGSLTFSYAFNPQTRFLESLLTESGEANTLTRNDLALEVKMIKSLALSLGVSVRHNSEPLPGLKRTETLTTVNLVYLKTSGP
jgi:putative salt-induced outer membrane protein